ncbi:phosphoadenosine phosphosulfate reductase family protein [Halomonas daqingensis]|uniref:Phosphoadenosine phosphosulfate reductase family protein n=2 Tax=Billgrantia desiderata TaxID=52021 RepID=A0AAW4YRZ5_9GAMM|nr:phosphoadenosine phosphosulfate reductase family protein [Halomonas desiderata]MCE8014081.1 phosphoadenosine phosphosulfate reductase family protein [Halomonas desiderata]MCE8044855.1 phosphoadenosine phosphosulfate reductase family protein [Halomonas desiderata]MCE8049429.1 phosphoadenosine phosphosulfate reductase family protein [Halomonas desiderata]MCE8051442.1 phosphoadenosine phosphosulfate reductase family protein [Halomonas desiderata]OUE37834.1 phosphoadenylylsulfate reductase [Hal
MMAALDAINQELGSDPDGLIRWALTQGQRPIVTTNFRPFEAVILHMVTQQRPDIPVVWMDHGYNTEATYRFADALVKRLDLNLISYIPQRTRAHREAVDGAMPGIDDPRHEAFTREVKLEPFERALREMAPDVWFTALRAEDTPERARMQPVSRNADGLLKVSPLLHWSAKELYQYLQQHDLPNEFDYFDPTKVEAKRECGLHLQH